MIARSEGQRHQCHSAGPNLNISPSISPTVRYSPNLNLDDQQTSTSRARTPSGAGSQDQFTGDGSVKKTKKNAPAGVDQRFVAREVLIEVDGNPTDAEADAIARRHRLTRAQSQNFPLVGSTMYRWRIPDNCSVNAVVRRTGGRQHHQIGATELPLQTAATANRSSLPSKAIRAAIRSGRSCVCRKPSTLARGDNVTIAVIDPGIDVSHPESRRRRLAQPTMRSEAARAPVCTDTGIAEAIAAHLRLMEARPPQACWRSGLRRVRQ